MACLNANYLKLKAGYLFPEIQRRVTEYAREHPESAQELIRCGIGDVTQPLPQAVREAMHRAVDEMGETATFRGYGPAQGYDFLRHAIAENDYRARGLDIDDDEIFVSDGSKCDCGNILDIFGPQNRIAVMDPGYPVYVDTNIMAGHTDESDGGSSSRGLISLACTKENHFTPGIPSERADIIYLCYPNNPTGATASRENLSRWVAYAREHESVILFDGAYEAYISDAETPRSIYEIPGARECAIEFRSFSKNGGFTGIRCGYTVLPKSLLCRIEPNGERRPLHPLWSRRFSTKFNGVSYVTQRAAEAIYSPEGKVEVKALVDHYLGNAAILSGGLNKNGGQVFGGTNAPFLWVHPPGGLGSWDQFDRILRELRIVVTPGSGFGQAGEGYFRVSAFNPRNLAEEAAHRFVSMQW